MSRLIGLTCFGVSYFGLTSRGLTCHRLTTPGLTSPGLTFRAVTLRGLWVCILLALSPFSMAQDKAASIDDFAFLQGFWVGTGFGGVSEEMWMPASDGSMFGIFKQSSEAGITFTEFMEITQVGGEFVLRLKHFNPDFSGWEEKDENVTFRLESVAPNKAVFNGLSYTLVDPTHLRIELRLRENDGSVNTEVFELRKGDL